MRWLKRAKGRRSGERGATALIVALLFTSLTIVATLALSVDLGNAVVERRVVQNGADAAVMALAQACAKGDASGCVTSPNDTLTNLAGNNATAGYSNDSTTEITSICANTGGGFAPCPAGDYSTLTKCLPASANVQSGKFVEVRTRTNKTADGGSALPKVFSEFLTGGGPGLFVEACARAAWGPATSTGFTLPIVMGKCEWLVKKQDEIAPPPDYSPAPNNNTTQLPVKDGKALADYAVGLQAHANGSEDAGPPNCRRVDQTNGQYFPGGFGWLAADTNCQVNVDANSWVRESPGGSIPNGCKQRWDGGNGNSQGINNAMAPYVGTVVFLPIVDDWDASHYGNAGGYHVEGVVAFFFAGFRNPSAGTYEEYQQQPPDSVCSSKCIWGWFTSGLLPLSAAGGSGTPGPDYGAEQIYPAG